MIDIIRLAGDITLFCFIGIIMYRILSDKDLLKRMLCKPEKG